jgi:hypothetical protein
MLFKISVNPREQQNETVFDQRPPLNLRNILFYFALVGHNWKAYIKLLTTERILLYIRKQSVPRCKHFPPRL